MMATPPTAVPSQSTKLSEILRKTWASPVFGDSYPPVTPVTSKLLAERIAAVYAVSVTTLREIIGIGMPELSSAERDGIVAQVAAKSVGFCGAIAVNDLDDIERLRAASVCIALVSWCDQTMDRGDTAMRAAVQLLTERHAVADEIGHNPLVQARVAALGYFVRETAALCRPEDALWVLRLILRETLQSEVRMLALTDRFVNLPAAQFWATHADEVARRSVHDVGFLAVVAMIYAIYRQRDPSLPPLTEALHDTTLMTPLLGPGNAAIRIFDDIGDREIDTGMRPEWGRFTLNVCNQCEPTMLEAFLRYAGFADADTRRDVLAAIVGQRYPAVIEAFIRLNRAAFQALPAATQTRHAIFLTLARRVIEAGFVNMEGDDWLAERALGA